MDVPYKHLEVVGVLPRRVPLATSGPNFTVAMDSDFLEFKNVTGYDCKRLEEESTYERVRALDKNAWISIDKCDVGPFDLEGDPIFEKAMKFMDILMEPVLTTVPHTGSVDIKMAASPGLPYTMKKIKDKKSALESEIFHDLKYRTDYVPLASIATKDEFLPMEDLKRDKVRTTFSTPLELILKSKLFFEDQNENIKEASCDMWIQYGMTKQYGGFDRVLQKISEFTHCVQSDASGYDRSAYLYWVYYLRWRHLKLVRECDDVFWHVTFHSIFPFCVCPDGTVIMRQTGNNSGANNTASDNSILHQLIVLYLFIYAYKKRYGVHPELEDILNNAYVPIYSDDKIGGINFEFFGWETAEDFRRDEIYVYSLFNMVIKPSSVLVTKIENNRVHPSHEFLGSSAAYSEEHGRYFGYPRVGKICSSVTRVGLSKLDENQKFWKLLALLSLSVAEPWLFDAILAYIKFRIYKSKQPNYYKDLLENFGGETIEENMRIHLGFETRQCLVFNSRKFQQKFEAEDLCFILNFFLKPGKYLVVGGFKNLNMNRMTGGQILQKLVEQRTITPEGKAWLTLAVDPWHDNPVTDFQGLPDQGVGKSVTFQVTQEYSIAKNNAPATLPAGNWSVRIGNLPILQDQKVSPGFFYGDVVSQDNVITPTTDRLLKSVMVNYAPDGADMADTALNLPLNAQGCSLPPGFTKGIVKLCGMGIEVVNTTAELQKQGLMTCCRMPQPDPEQVTSYVALTSPANSWATKSLTPMRTLPKNLAEMAKYPGFAQDEAKNGYYAPVLMKLNKAKHYPVALSVLLLDDDPQAGTFSPASPIACYTSQSAPLVVPGNSTSFNVNAQLPLLTDVDSNVVFFTGLSDSTTLTLRVRYLLERFPSDAEEQILAIATPSAPYDPQVLELYSKAVQMLPAGVPFTENPSGEWWKSMLTEIGKVASPLLKMLPHPIAQGAARAVDAGVLMLGEDDVNKKLAAEVRKANAAKRKLTAAENKAKAVTQAVGTPNNKGNIPGNNLRKNKKKKKPAKK